LFAVVSGECFWEAALEVFGGVEDALGDVGCFVGEAVAA